MLDRNALEIAAGSGSLGLLADDVLIALVHELSARTLTGRDRLALERAQSLLKAVTELQQNEIVTGPLLRSMAPLNALNEAADAVSSATTGDVSADIARHLATIDGILNGHAEPDSVSDLRQLFERLSEFTWNRSNSLVRPARDQWDQWIRTVSKF